MYFVRLPEAIWEAHGEVEAINHSSPRHVSLPLPVTIHVTYQCACAYDNDSEVNGAGDDAVDEDAREEEDYGDDEDDDDDDKVGFFVSVYSNNVFVLSSNQGIA